MLPAAGVIVGAVALIIGGYAAVSLSKVKTTLAAHEEKIATIDGIAAQAASAGAAGEKAAKDIATLQNQTQTAVNTIATDLGTIHDQLKHLEEARVRPAAAGKGGPHEAAVAGPGEYVVKSGDTGAKIARAEGCSIAALKEVNPSVNWNKMKVGDKLKLPEKKAATP